MPVFLHTETSKIRNFILTELSKYSEQVVIRSPAGELTVSFKLQNRAFTSGVMFTHPSTESNGLGQNMEAILRALFVRAGADEVGIVEGSEAYDEYEWVKLPEKEQYEAMFENERAAVEFENEVLSAAKLPGFASDVRDGYDPDPQYFCWLMGQKEDADQGSET